MSEPRAGAKFFSLDEANALLPQVRRQLGLLKEIRGRIFGLQARVDIEELTATPSSSGARKAELLEALEGEVRDFHRGMEAFHALGCELKDLERGLVDFYSMRGNEVVFLCWMDGEAAIQFWHPLDTGVKGRKPL